VGLTYFITRTALLPFTRLYLGMRVAGARRIPRRGGVLIVANHCSHLDPILLGCSASRPLSFLARSTLFRPAPFAWYLRRLGALPLERGKSDRATLERAAELLREGKVLAIFPEGTRSPDGQIQEAKGGAGLLALKAGVPIVPAHIAGSYRSMPRGVAIPRPARIRITYGEPRMAEEWLKRRPPDEKPARAIALALMEEIRRLGAGGA
jgi:1-acyl-sn-glycerol-3-phosphate acyltransferase